MIRYRVGRYGARIREELRTTFAEEHTTREIAGSFALGVLLLGPVEGAGPTDVSFGAGSEIVARLLVGNLLLAVVATVVSYAIVYRLAVAYRTTELGDIIDDAVEEIVEEVIEE